jgi:hypothetical protein
MELLLILLYTSICVVIFKIFRIPVNQWSLSTAVLGGIVGIALLLVGMAYNHPFSANAYLFLRDAGVCRGAWKGDRCAREGKHPTKGGRCALSNRP